MVHSEFGNVQSEFGKKLDLNNTNRHSAPPAIQN